MRGFCPNVASASSPGHPGIRRSERTRSNAANVPSGLSESPKMSIRSTPLATATIWYPSWRSADVSRNRNGPSSSASNSRRGPRQLAAVSPRVSSIETRSKVEGSCIDGFMPRVSCMKGACGFARHCSYQARPTTGACPAWQVANGAEIGSAVVATFGAASEDLGTSSVCGSLSRVADGHATEPFLTRSRPV